MATSRRLPSGVAAVAPRGVRRVVTSSSAALISFSPTVAAIHMERSVRMASSTYTEPPKWIGELKRQGKTQEKSLSYDLKIFDEMIWQRLPFSFDALQQQHQSTNASSGKGANATAPQLSFWDTHTLPSNVRSKLCLGNEAKEYTLVGEIFPFPDRDDSPVVNEPRFMARLWWDHESPTEKLLIQLSPMFPPLLWLSIRPTLDALRKVFREFLNADAAHMKENLPYFEELQSRVEAQTKEKLGDGLSPQTLREAFVDGMRQRDPATLRLDWTGAASVVWTEEAASAPPKEHEPFPVPAMPTVWNAQIGTTEHFRLVEDNFLKRNPFVFGWPLLLSDGNVHMEGSPMKCCAFRTIYSKSLLLIHSRLDLQVDSKMMKLPSGRGGDEDHDGHNVVLDIPVFLTVNYPTNVRLSGGAAFVKRINDAFNTSFPSDMPIDVIAALLREPFVKGVVELRKDIAFLTLAAEKVPHDLERTIRLATQHNATNRILGQLAHTIVYLAILEDPKWKQDCYDLFCAHPCEMVRMACAKGAEVLGAPELIEALVAKEADGRGKELMKMMLEVAIATHGGPTAEQQQRHGGGAPSA